MTPNETQNLRPLGLSVRRGPAIHKKIIWNRGMASDEPFKPYSVEHPVRVMCSAEGYAMVRRKGSSPYIAPVKELFEPNE